VPFADVLEEANTNSTAALYLNFSSGYRPRWFGIPRIRAVCNTINPQIAGYFTTHTQGRFGILAMDFADANQCGLIIKTNFKD